MQERFGIAAFRSRQQALKLEAALKREGLPVRMISTPREVALGCGLLLSVRPVLAETIWDRFSSIMQDIYGQVVAISTIVAVTVAAIALIVRMVSRNQRAVDEATSWLKRIVVTWIVLNTLGFIVAYLQPLIAGGQYTGG